MIYSQEAEKSVIAVLLLEPENIGYVTRELNPDDFYSPLLKEIYRSMLAVSLAGEKIDVLSLSEDMTKRGVYSAEVKPSIEDTLGGSYGFNSIKTSVKNVRDKALLRNILNSSMKLQDAIKAGCKKEDALSLTAKLAMMRDVNIPVPSTAGSLAFEVCNDLANHVDGDTELGTFSGFDRLDRITSGFRGGQLIIVGARPAVGKTTFAMQVAINVEQEYEAPVLFYSLEMTKKELVERVISNVQELTYKT